MGNSDLLRCLNMPLPFTPILDRLLTKMNELVPPSLYPAHVLPIPGRIDGTAFFPGGSGLHLENRDLNSIEFPFGGVMILGHNFDSEPGFKKSYDVGKEQLGRGTWGPLLKLLGAVAIPPEQCFFTNAFMGLCEGSDNKSYQGRRDPAFRAACLSFLKFQIEIQRPRFILALGLHVPPLLACASPDLTAWKGKAKARSCDPKLFLKDLDAALMFNAARFELDDGSVHTALVTAIAHPSDRRNGARRTLRGFDGEVDLVRMAWEKTGLLQT
jgi:hypothetical protein